MVTGKKVVLAACAPHMIGAVDVVRVIYKSNTVVLGVTAGSVRRACCVREALNHRERGSDPLKPRAVQANAESTLAHLGRSVFPIGRV